MKRIFAKIALRERPWMGKAALALMLLAAFALRMYDLTNPPLDFASTRQLYSALKARAMYYQYLPDAPEWQREVAAMGNLGNIEPPLMETLVAQTWRLTGEHLWVARIYSALFWVLGGLALYLLARELTASTGAALISTLIYLFVPYGVIASRAFQPDPLMVALAVYSLWALFRWQNTGKWKWVVLFGVFGGLTLFVKNLSVFVVAGAFVGVLLGVRSLKRVLRNPQVWTMGILLVLPVGVYMVYGMITGGLEGQFALRFFPNLWLDPAFYFSWQNLMSTVTGFAVWTAGIIGVFLSDGRRERPFLLGMWIGYILYGFTFSYHFITHDYYHLPLIPIAALSVAPLVKLVLERFSERNPGLFTRLVLVVLVLFGVSVQSWYAIAKMKSQDYHNEPAFWQEVGDILGHNINVIGLTQDYGYRLLYWGWQNSTAWLTSADISVRYLAGQNVDVAAQFAEDTAGKQFFVVTMFGELDNQPVIKDYLYSHFPIYAQTDEYVIFDLQHTLNVKP
jgi:4-amino-4-deoxy-L-arabinose transferase-like glycosyltransferase